MSKPTTTKPSSKNNGDSSDITKSETIIRITLTLVLVYCCLHFYLRNHETLGIRVPRHSKGAHLDRLVFSLRWSTWSLVPLVLSLSHVMFTRLFTAALNPLSGNDHQVDAAKRILANTVEQTLLHFPSVLVLSLNVPPNYLCLVPFLVMCFVFGRVSFLVGYLIHPRHRELGFVFTYVPSVMALGYNIWCLMDSSPLATGK